MSTRAALCLALAALAFKHSLAAQPLPNPFARPGGATVADSADTAPIELRLRATLVRGRASSANIGGTIVRVGERVGEYRLVSVHEGAAVLVDAAGVTHVLEIEPPQVAP
jgi:hypothetical protein